jgi:hypothetical protein
MSQGRLQRSHHVNQHDTLTMSEGLMIGSGALGSLDSGGSVRRKSSRTLPVPAEKTARVPFVCARIIPTMRAKMLWAEHVA